LEDNVEKYGRQATDINIIRRMRIISSITKATDKNTEYVTRIAVPLQQLLDERASILRLYVNCLSRLAIEMNRVQYEFETLELQDKRLTEIDYETSSK
jgi:hypothetical protein